MLVRIPVRLLLLILVVSLTSVVSAFASPAQVIRDFSADGQLNRTYSWGDVRAAAHQSRGTVTGDGLNQAIVDRLSVELGGFSAPTRSRSAAPAPGAVAKSTPATSKKAKTQKEIALPARATPRNEAELPAAGLPGFTNAPVGSPAGGLPILVTILGFLGGALLLSGLTSGVARRRLDRSRSTD
jgi:hypothetical protein